MTRQLILLWSVCLVGARAQAAIEIEIPAARLAPSNNSAAAPAAAADDAPAERMDELRFWNGDRLRGRLLDFPAPETGVGWLHPAFAGGAPVRFDPAHLSDIRLAPRSEPAGRAVPQATLQLRNGDRLGGRILGLDGEIALLETDFGGTLRIRRDALARIDFGHFFQVLYAGPNPADEWKSSQQDTPAIVAPDGSALILRGAGVYTLPLDPPVPRAVRAEVEIERRGLVMLTFLLFADPTERGTGESLFVTMAQERQLSVGRNLATGQSVSLGTTDISGYIDRSAQRTRIGLLADRDQGLFAVLINDRVAYRWNDPDARALEGRSIGFLHRTATARITGIRVQSWDGQIPDGTRAEPRDADSIVFVNGDVVSGSLLGIADGAARLESPVLSVDLPLERLRSVSLAGSGDPAAPSAGWTRVALDTTAQLTFESVIWTLTELRGRSGAAGDVTIPMDRVRRIEFLAGEEDGEDPDEAP